MEKQKMLVTVGTTNPRSRLVLEALLTLHRERVHTLDLSDEKGAAAVDVAGADCYVLYDYNNCNLIREVEPTGESVPKWAHHLGLRCFKIGPACDSPERALECAQKILRTKSKKEPPRSAQVYNLEEARQPARARLSIGPARNLRA